MIIATIKKSDSYSDFMHHLSIFPDQSFDCLIDQQFLNTIRNSTDNRSETYLHVDIRLKVYIINGSFGFIVSFRVFNSVVGSKNRHHRRVIGIRVILIATLVV